MSPRKTADCSCPDRRVERHDLLSLKPLDALSNPLLDFRRRLKTKTEELVRKHEAECLGENSGRSGVLYRRGVVYHCWVIGSWRCGPDFGSQNNPGMQGASLVRQPQTGSEPSPLLAGRDLALEIILELTGAPLANR
jgi:hypothetical protein